MTMQKAGLLGNVVKREKLCAYPRLLDEYTKRITAR